MYGRWGRKPGGTGENLGLSGAVASKAGRKKRESNIEGAEVEGQKCEVQYCK